MSRSRAEPAPRGVYSAPDPAWKGGGGRRSRETAMKPRIASATFLLLALAVLAAGSGCGHDQVTQPPPQEEHGIEQGPVPPPISTGLDTAHVGGTATPTWRVWNESPMPFTMQWTLESQAAWPGLPQSGSLALAAWEEYLFTATVSVPDTAATGYRWLALTITRPHGSPLSAVGTILVVP